METTTANTVLNVICGDCAAEGGLGEGPGEPNQYPNHFLFKSRRRGRAPTAAS